MSFKRIFCCHLRKPTCATTAVHKVNTDEGAPVVVFLTPGGYNDTKHLRSFELDFPEGQCLTETKPTAIIYRGRSD